MEVLDTSIANAALPHIAGSLSASQDESTWVLTSYLVANAIILPISGWISSVIGRKNFYLISVVMFTVFSALCGVAPTLGLLVVFRVLQGVAGGGLQPSVQAILADAFPGNKRGMAMAVYTVAILCAPVLGPTLGGWITDNYSWRWIFYINIPVGVACAFFTRMVLVDPIALTARRLAQKGKKLRIDGTGLALIAIGLASLEIVLDKGQGARLARLHVHRLERWNRRRCAGRSRRLGALRQGPRRQPAPAQGAQLPHLLHHRARRLHRSLRDNVPPAAVYAAAHGLLRHRRGHRGLARRARHHDRSSAGRLGAQQGIRRSPHDRRGHHHHRRSAPGGSRSATSTWPSPTSSGRASCRSWASA